MLFLNRNYVVSSADMTADDASAFCAGLGLNLVKWDNTLMFHDVGLVLGRKKDG